MANVATQANPFCNSAWPWVEPVAGVGGTPPGGVRWPRVSVVIVTKGEPAATLRMVRSVLAQGYPDVEPIVVHDGDEGDGLREAVGADASRVAHWEHRPGAATAAAFDHGAAAASGEVLTVMSGEDVHLPWTLWCAALAFATFPQVRWLRGCPARSSGGVVHRVGAAVPYPRELVRRGLFHDSRGGLGRMPPACSFWRRSLWDEAGGFANRSPAFAVRCAERDEVYVASTVLAGSGAAPPSPPSPPEDPATRGAGGVRGLRAYQALRRVGVARRLVARAAGLRRFRGPVLKWDFSSTAYRLSYERLFP